MPIHINNKTSSHTPKEIYMHDSSIKHEKPTPIDEEITLNPKKYILSKTDSDGVITYCNDYFIKICGYKKDELIGSPHNIIRHPDMPKIIFKLMWDRLESRKNICALVKNLSKDGKYYWVMTDFETKIFKNQNGAIEIEYIAYRKAAPKKAIPKIEQLYKKLIDIEAKRGIKGSKKYLIGFLEERGQTYDEYINEITNNNKFTQLWFKSMKTFFSLQSI